MTHVCATHVEVHVLDICNFQLGNHVGASDHRLPIHSEYLGSAVRETTEWNAYRTRANTVRIAIVIVIIGRFSVAKHPHDAREPKRMS